jgi:ribosomal protein S12 methylthiotransferase accessory factor
LQLFATHVGRNYRFQRVIMHYQLTLQSTTASSGYFSCEPETPMALQEALDYLKTHPYDDFIRKHLLTRLGELDEARMQRYLGRLGDEDRAVRALFFETCLIHPHLKHLLNDFSPQTIQAAVVDTSLIYIHAHTSPLHPLYSRWAAIFRDNLVHHRPLPDPETINLEMPDAPEAMLLEDQPLLHLAELSAEQCQADPAPTATQPSAAETAALALERLNRLKILQGEQMRHIASLSPYGLLQQWRFSVSVAAHRHRYTFSGLQTAYGKGLSLDDARASCVMEIVERCAAFASFEETHLPGYLEPHVLKRATLGDLLADGWDAIGPNRFRIDITYQDQPLYWIQGTQITRSGSRPVWIPAQMVFLFCNLDEISLYHSYGSTGLASGNTPQEAKLNALLEWIERDSEAANPYHPCRCFQVHASEERLGALFEDYWARGIKIQFQDISPAYGVPCCICFVVGRDGVIAKGAGAHLNGQRAVLAALTETPYPYPYGPPSLPGPDDVPILDFASLPNFSSVAPDTDLRRVETVLVGNGFEPIYVDLTRSDLQLPVFRALVPGMAPSADLDDYSRPDPRLFYNYLKIFNK